MSARACLSGARALIAAKGWTQGTMAKKADGQSVSTDHPAAACFCILGAMEASGHFACFAQAVRFLRWAINDKDVVSWNDAPGRTREEIITALDGAIALAERAEREVFNVA